MGDMYKFYPKFLSALTYLPWILALRSQPCEMYICGLLKESDICWNLCGRAAADQAVLRLNLPAEPPLKMLPDKAEKGEIGI